MRASAKMQSARTRRESLKETGIAAWSLSCSTLLVSVGGASVSCMRIGEASTAGDIGQGLPYNRRDTHGTLGNQRDGLERPAPQASERGGGQAAARPADVRC